MFFFSLQPLQYTSKYLIKEVRNAVCMAVTVPVTVMTCHIQNGTCIQCKTGWIGMYCDIGIIIYDDMHFAKVVL